MHSSTDKKAAPPRTPPFAADASRSGCPHIPAAASTPSASQKPSPLSTIAALNPLNQMPSDLSQSREFSTQAIALPVEREMSSIPRGVDENSASKGQEGNWVYPSPQQMFNAMLRKGYTDTPSDSIEAMVAVHNFLNEGAWAEIVEWERRFSRGLLHGWGLSRFGEDGSLTGAMIAPSEHNSSQDPPKLLRFMGRSDAVTPKAQLMSMASSIAPSYFGGTLPFDRHDWFVERTNRGGKKSEIRYVIDYYSAGVEPTGEPVFYLDIRPALDGPSAAAERLIRWGRDVWWRASGGRACLGEDV